MERVAIAGGVMLLLGGIALLLSPWLEALTDARRRLVRLLAAAVAAACLAPGLAATATLSRHAGHAGLPVAGLLVLALLSPLPWLAESTWGRRLLLLLGVAAVALDVALPRRLYPAVRLLLLVLGFAALGGARRRGEGRPTAWGWAATAVAALVLLGGGRALVDVSANARFVASAQAPAAGFVLDGLALLSRAPRHRPASGAATRPSEDDPPLVNLFPGGGVLTEANLVVITVDALRADRLRSDFMPHLAALAERGVSFQRAYAAAPSTARSITALLTGHHPAHLAGRPPTLAELLRGRGWNTAAFYPAGLFFDGGGTLDPYDKARFGFAFTDTQTRTAAPLTDAVLARVRKIEREGEPRSFLWVHYFDTHEPYEGRPDLPADAPAQARYDSAATKVDAEIFRLLRGLCQLKRPTLVVLTADHGEEFGEHGGAYHGSSLYEEQVRVPLLMTMLGAELEPRTVVQPVSLVDVLPTVVASLGVPQVATDGQDLAHDASGDIFATVFTRRMLVRGEWKLIHDLRREVDELYDLSTDPREQRNLVDSQPKREAELRAALDQWLDQLPSEALITRLLERAGPPAERAKAARQLGERECKAAQRALRRALTDRDPTVHAEAAIALGQIIDPAARPALIALLRQEPYADRAALTLGRLRDPAGAPRLQSILRRGVPSTTHDASLQREAAHFLGFIGGEDDVAALFAAAEDPRVRGAAFVSLGRIAGRSDDRALAARLRDTFAHEQRSDARVDLAWALGLAGDKAAIPLLATAAAASPPLARASEALVRLGAVDGDAVGGLDLSCSRASTPGLEAPLDQWLGATRCPLSGPSAVYHARAPGDAKVVVVRARALGDNARVTVSIDGQALPPFNVGPRFVEKRLVRTASGGAASVPVRIEVRRQGAPIELDHVLLLRQVTPAPL